MRFYNREKELASLEKVRGVSFSVHSQMTVLTGRRRIGKTSLIFKSCENTPTVYLFVSRSNETALCLRFVSEIRQALNIYVPELTNFAEVFRFLMDLGTRMAYNLLLHQSRDLQPDAGHLGSVEETEPCQSYREWFGLYPYEQNLQGFQRTVVRPCRQYNEISSFYYFRIKRNHVGA